MENVLSLTNGSVRGECVRVLSRVQSKFSTALVSHRGKKLLQDLLNLDNTTIKRAMVGFRGQREKSAIPSICRMPGVSQEHTMKDSLWKETLGKNL